MSKIQGIQTASTTYTKQQDCHISPNKEVSFTVLTNQFETIIRCSETPSTVTCKM
jgi:hypothetical protein